MDESAYLAAVPFAPGESPFKMKGQMFVQALDFMSGIYPGGRDALIASLEPAYARFYSQQFLSSQWYDVFPAPYLGYALARATGRTFEDVSVATARSQTEENVRGIYKIILRLLISPEAILSRMPAMTEQTFSFAPATVVKAEPKSYMLERAKFPAILEHWYAPVAETFVRVALEAAGTKGVEIIRAPSLPDGTENGVALVKLGFTVRWA